MRAMDVVEFVRQRPFKPFVVTLTDGRSYTVQHPELAMVGLSSVAIGIPAENMPTPVYDRMITVSIEHIMQIEPVETASSQS